MQKVTYSQKKLVGQCGGQSSQIFLAGGREIKNTPDKIKLVD